MAGRNSTEDTGTGLAPKFTHHVGRSVQDMLDRHDMLAMIDVIASIIQHEQRVHTLEVLLVGIGDYNSWTEVVIYGGNKEDRQPQLISHHVLNRDAPPRELHAMITWSEKKEAWIWTSFDE